jgi:hypothetical protein
LGFGICLVICFFHFLSAVPPTRQTYLNIIALDIMLNSRKQQKKMKKSQGPPVAVRPPPEGKKQFVFRTIVRFFVAVPAERRTLLKWSDASLLIFR